MPKWWPFQKNEDNGAKENEAFAQAEADLRAHIKQQHANGVSAQAVLYFIENQAQALEKEEQTVQVKGKLRAYDLLYSELRPRILDNLSSGKAMEMAGRIEEACQHYEQAIRDQVSTRFPYEHLRVIYRREGNYEDALRVCKLAVQNPFLSDKDQAHFEQWVSKLQQT